MKLSMLLPVYNEELLLLNSLTTTLPYIDEAVIINGSPWGPSTDKTKEIIFSLEPPLLEKVKYLEGAFVNDDGSWDESAQRNLGLSKVTGDFLMPHCADMIYSESDIREMRYAIERFPEKKIFYCLFIEFFCDTNHIRLYRDAHHFASWYPVPVVGDIPILSMQLNPYYENGPQLRINQDFLNGSDFVYVHNAIRYHYGWVKPFKTQVEKHVRNVKLKQWGEHGQSLLEKGEKAIYAWAISHVLEYDSMDCKYVFTGKQPDVLKNRFFSYLEGHAEALKEYEIIFGEQFWMESY